MLERLIFEKYQRKLRNNGMNFLVFLTIQSMRLRMSRNEE